MQPDIEQRISKWLTMLADLTIAGSEPVTPDRISTIAGMLAKDRLPPAAFTTDSLHHVAQEQRFFPPYVDIVKALWGWWDAHKPASAPMLPGDEAMARLSALDRSWLSFWHKRRAEIYAADVHQRGSREADMAALASLVRDQSAKAWAVVAGRETVAVGPTAQQVADVAAMLAMHVDAQKGPAAAPVAKVGGQPSVTVTQEVLNAIRLRRVRGAALALRAASAGECAEEPRQRADRLGFGGSDLGGSSLPDAA